MRTQKQPAVGDIIEVKFAHLAAAVFKPATPFCGGGMDWIFSDG